MDQHNTNSNFLSMSYDQIIASAMKNQPIVNIGMIGSVSDGKSTLTKCLTGTATQKHTAELKRNITIKLGYANAKIFKCDFCPSPQNFQCAPSYTVDLNCKLCNNPTTLIMHTSHVDCPGHDDLINVMLNGTAVMDYTLLVESCQNEVFPEKQTIEHYNITKTVGIKPLAGILNKSDLMINNKNKIFEMINVLRNFMTNNNNLENNNNLTNDSTNDLENIKQNIPIIPISGTLELNIDVVCELLAKLTVPKKDLTSDFKMIVIRSFNVNHPGISIENLKGGVLGGSIVRGIMKINDHAIIYPGFKTKILNATDQETRFKYTPLKCRVISINSDKNNLDFAISGGLIGVQLDIDPGLSCNDNLVGQVLLKDSDNLSHVKVFEIIQITHNKLQKDIVINEGDFVIANINSNNIKCKIIKKKSKYLNLLLDTPICAEINDKVTINAIIFGKQVIYGYGEILDGSESQIM